MYQNIIVDCCCSIGVLVADGGVILIDQGKQSFEALPFVLVLQTTMLMMIHNMCGILLLLLADEFSSATTSSSGGGGSSRSHMWWC